MPRPDGAVRDAVVALGRALRDRGVRVSIDEELTLCRALGAVDVRSRSQVYWATRACFLRRPAETLVFDPLFDRFWEGLELDGRRGAEFAESDPRMPGPQHGGESVPQFRQEGRSSHLVDGAPLRATQEIPTAPGDDLGDGRRRGVLAAWSPEEMLTRTRPVEFGPDELAALRRLSRDLRAAVPMRRSRRLGRSRRPGRLDLGRTVRCSLRSDGELMHMAWRAPSARPRRLVLLCDVSGSMERYSRVLLASMEAAVRAGVKAEAFAFATRLTRLTRELTGDDLAQALEAAREAIPDWSGGTRIGGALGEFNRTHGRRGLLRGAIVLVVSDGWDRGDPDALAAEVRRLAVQCRRLIWVNPRAGGLDGQPLAIGMRAVLPHVDDYVPGHDHRARAGLAGLLSTMSDRRPARSQRPLPSGS
jgi:uncharacterized protein with von Willebrand factor type A (vWA) domain